MAAALLFLAVATVGWAVWTLWRLAAAKPSTLDIPYLQFDDGDNSPDRYTADAWKILRKGYNTHLKHGHPFSMYNHNDLKRPLVLLPMKYLEEVRSAPQTKLSLPAHINKRSFAFHIGGPPFAEEVQHTAKLDLNRALNNLIQPMQEQCIIAFRKDMPACSVWTEVKTYAIIMQIFARMSARVMVGEELCGDEWQQKSLEYISGFFVVIQALKQNYSPRFYWLAKYFNAEIKGLFKRRRAMAEFLAPTLKARNDALNTHMVDAERPEDAIQWLIEEHRARGQKLTPDTLTQNIIITMFASIHSTSSIGLSMVFNLLDHPEYLVEIKEEISRAQQKHLQNSPFWTRQALAELRVLDSVMRETLRMNSFTELTLQRVALVPYTFKDGLYIPAGTEINFASRQQSFDPDIYPDAETFDPKRWQRKRQEVDSHRFHFASTADDFINWGSGAHACPGRFLADVTLKLIFVHLLSYYEFKHPDGVQSKPTDKRKGLMVDPSMDATIMVKEKVFE